jgi:PAS domain S-box-containing protein/putative nucleotidyltransferase with HDIG domain
VAARLAGEPFDLVFLDVTRADGIFRQMLSRERSDSAAAPFLAATGVPDHDRGSSALREGADEYLLKEKIDEARLDHCIRAALSRKTLQSALTASNAMYDRLLRSVTDYTYSVALDNGRPGSSSHGPGCIAVTGYSPGEYAADPDLWFRMIHDLDRGAVLDMASDIVNGRTPPPVEHRIVHKDGSIRWIKNTAVPRYDSAGRLVAYDGLVTDITDRKRAELELLQANKSLLVLSRCNQALVRASGEKQLLKDVCSIIIELGEYRMCWVGFRDAAEGGRIIPAASAGHDEGYLAVVFLPGLPERNEREPAVVSVKTSGRVIIRDTAAEPDSFWLSQAVSHGYSSLLALPLLSGDRAIGALTIAASEPDAFDENEVEHLQDLAYDLAYGVSALRSRETQRTMEAALRESELKRHQEFVKLERAKQEWEVTFDAIADPIFIHDKDSRILRANKACCEIAGLPFADMIGRPFFDVFPGLGIASLPEAEDPYCIERGGAAPVRRLFRRKVYPLTGEPFSSVQILEDITEMKKAEKSIREEMEITANLLSLAEIAGDTMDVDRLMERVVNQCGKILRATVMLSYVWDREAELLRPGQHWGLSHQDVPIFKTSVIDPAVTFGRTPLEARRPFVLIRQAAVSVEKGDLPAVMTPLEQTEEIQSSVPVLDPLPWLPGCGSLVAVPLAGKTHILGFLMAGFPGREPLSERGKKIVEGIARQVSLALDEAFLYHKALESSMELANKMETLKVIHEIDLSILSSLEPRQILETAIRNIARIIPCDRAEAVLLDRDRQACSRITNQGDSTDQQKDFALAGSGLESMFAMGRPHYIPDLAPSGGGSQEAYLLQNGLRCLIRAPLVSKGCAIGVLSLASSRPAAFSPENLATLEQLAGLIGVAFENTRLLTDLQELFLGTVKSLSYAIDAKSSWTAGHSGRVTEYALLLGRKIGLSDQELRDLELAGLLHDVGKLGTYDAILDKNGVLTDEEYEIIKRHPVRGAELLAPIKQMKRIIPAVKHHHERFDGGGYPQGLKGRQIPDLARILAVADAFDSMTGWRPYRKTFGREEAIDELRRCAGSQFDPHFAQGFIDALESAAGLSATVPHAAAGTEQTRSMEPPTH